MRRVYFAGICWIMSSILFGSAAPQRTGTAAASVSSFRLLVENCESPELVKRAACGFYLTGFVEGYGIGENHDNRHLCFKAATAENLRAAILDHAKSNPFVLDDSRSFQTAVAFTRKFYCSDR